MRADAITVSRQGNLAVINHKNFEIKFNLSKGTWDYIDQDATTIIRDSCSEITFDDETVIKTEDAGIREFVTDTLETDGFGDYQRIRFSHEATGKDVRINTYLKCYTEDPAIHIRVGVENLKSEPIQLKSLTVLGVSADRARVLVGGLPSDYHLFVNMPPVSPGVSKRLYDGFLLSEVDTMYPSNDGVLHDTKNNRTLGFGFLTTEKWWPRVQVGAQNKPGRGKQATGGGVHLWSLYNECRHRCDSGEELLSETAYINFTGDLAEVCEHYTARAATSHTADQDDPPIKIKGRTPTAAWTLSNTEEALDSGSLLTQVEALAADPMFQPKYPGGMGYVQFDATSVSETSVLLKDEGLHALPGHARAKGFKAGIRFNPFCVSLDSQLVKRHPEYCIQEPGASRPRRRYSRTQARRNTAKPATVHLPESGREVALLDVSHPKVQSLIQTQTKQMIAECGYSLINADFTAYTIGLTDTAPNFSWYDSSLTSVELYRLAVELLRDAITEARTENGLLDDDVRLTAYNAVPGPCIGLIDMNSPLLNASASTSNRENDSWHRQRGTKQRLGRYAAHLREHNVLWGHVFGEVAVAEPRPINEVIVEMTTAALSGGTVLCSDEVTTLTSARAAYLSKIFPLLGQAATPVDLYKEPFPKIWSLPISTPREDWYLAAVFNWDDYEDDAYFELDALGLPESKEFLVHDFWMRQYLGKVSENVTLLNIPPRSAKLLCFREEQDIPQLLATDMHYTQGGVEILSAGWDAHSLSYLLVCKPLRRGEGTCFIHVPEGYLPISAATHGSDYHYSWEKPICKVTFARTDPEQLVQASIHFVKSSGGNL